MDFKRDLIRKFDENLQDLAKASTEEDRNYYYAFCKGFLSAMFELPEISQQEFDDLSMKLESSAKCANACGVP